MVYRQPAEGLVRLRSGTAKKEDGGSDPSVKIKFPKDVDFVVAHS